MTSVRTASDPRTALDSQQVIDAEIAARERAVADGDVVGAHGHVGVRLRSGHLDLPARCGLAEPVLPACGADAPEVGAE